MLSNLQQLGFESMTAIQAQSLPALLENKDVIAQAKTGSGKTVAFGIGLLNKLDVKKFRVQALVLCPTRELADQVAKELRRLARFAHNIKILSLCGGVAMGPQFDSLRHQAHIIVGTPGRILKHLAKGSLSLSNIETLVLDEADRMLDMGFYDEIKQVINQTPEKRQTLLFSATYPKSILDLSHAIQNDAINIETINTDTANKVTEYFYDVLPDERMTTLIKVIGHHKPTNVIIFSNTKVETKEITQLLQRRGIDALAIHGDLEQYQRNDSLVKFSNGSCAVLVATDVAARGIDIKNLSLVINYQLPHDEETYTHRIGRTARAGNEGVAVTLCAGFDAVKAEKYRNDSRLFENATTLSTQENVSLKAPNSTLVIEAGKKDKLRPGDILGALCGDAGIDGKKIGKIDVFERQSYVAIERGIINKACEQLKKGKIKGRKISVFILK